MMSTYIERYHSRFSQTHTVGNIAVIAIFVFPYICSFLLYLHQLMLVNVKLEIETFHWIHFLLDQLVFDGTKLAMLAFLYCGEFVKKLYYLEAHIVRQSWKEVVFYVTIYEWMSKDPVKYRMPRQVEYTGRHLVNPSRPVFWGVHGQTYVLKLYENMFILHLP